jgi:nucleoside-diphosphate-sugar epimerase
VAPGELPKGSPKRRKPDISKLRALGFEPKVSLADGLPGTVEWYVANPREAAA